MYKYLFICRENIGRSQMAEAFYNYKHGVAASISAGIVNSVSKHEGKPRPDVAQIMNEIGIDISKQKIKYLTQKMLDQVENLMVLCDKEICPKFVLERKDVIYINVEDPPDKDKTLDILRKMRDQIKQIVEGL